MLRCSVNPQYYSYFGKDSITKAEFIEYVLYHECFAHLDRGGNVDGFMSYNISDNKLHDLSLICFTDNTIVFMRDVVQQLHVIRDRFDILTFACFANTKYSNMARKFVAKYGGKVKPYFSDVLQDEILHCEVAADAVIAR
jgi:hypothetical protein